MNYYNQIKKELIDNEINKRIKDYSKNKYELERYYNVGKLLAQAGKHYGDSIIKEYSKKLTLELGKKYDPSALNKMRKFYYIIAKMATVSPKLSYSHYVELLTINNVASIYYYIKISEEQNLSVRQLRERIKSKEYERLPIETKSKLIESQETSIIDYVKDPILIKSKNYDEVSEKTLQKLILEDMPSFLKELGEGFSFIDNEYPIKIGNNYNYIDILLFNYIHNCFVIVELKVTELKKDHIGQIQVYMNYIDKNIKSINHNKTIGIILCKKNNKYIIKYSSDENIISRTYELV